MARSRQTLRATVMNEQRDKRHEWREQNHPAHRDRPAPGKAALALEAATAEQSQHKHADAMGYQIQDEVHFILVRPPHAVVK